MELSVENLLLAIDAVESSADDGTLHTIDDLKDYLRENEDGYVEIITERRKL